MNAKLYKRQAAYYETDRMGIVHHSNYIRYFEEAKNAFLNEIGCDILEMENQGLIIPNVDAYARYITPIGFSDNFTVETRLTKFNGVRMAFEYTIILDKNNKIAATGHTMHCFASKDLKPVSIKHSFPNYFKKIKSNIYKSI